MTAVVLVGMSIAEVNEQQALRRQAAESGATLAFPSLFFVGLVLFFFTLTLNLVADRFVRRVRIRY